jgi:hypothetical protein
MGPLAPNPTNRWEVIAMNVKLLRNSVDELNGLRAELHGSVNDSVMEVLDEVIADLQEDLKDDPQKINARDVLELMGKVLEKLPAIVEAIKILSKLIG